MQNTRATDCIKLKDQLQAQLDRQYRGLKDAQIRERIHREMATSDAPIARLWRKLNKKRTRFKK